MNLILISALIAVCGAAKLDRTYLPPSADSSGGSPSSLQAPLTRTSEQRLETPNPPTGSYTNDFGGVVVDAAAGTRSAEGLSGLGGPRPSYGSSNSKVGDAAFRGSVAGFRGTQFGSTGQIGTEGVSGQFNSNENRFQTNSQLDTHSAQGFPSIGQTGSQTGQFSNQGFQNFENKSERPQAARDRNSNIVAQSNDVNADRYSYGFETDNGIAVGENGVDINGIQAEGGYSYQGDDGQVYKVTYVADERGYRPQGAHLPTPPPIPDEILKSLEQNAKEEAAGLVDDGSYDAQKYNTDSDYTHDNSGNIQHNGGQLSQFGKRPESASTFNNQNNQAFGTTGSTSFGTTSQTNGFDGNIAGAVPNTFGSNQDQEKLAQFGNSGSQTSFNGQGAQVNSQPGSSQFSSGSQVHPTFGQSSQANQFNSNSGSAPHANFGQSSHSSQQLSGHANTVSGQSFGQTGNQFSTSGHTPAFGSQTQFGSQFNQQASASALFENQTPESGSQQSQQGFNTALSSSSKPSSGQYSQDNSNTVHSQAALPESGTSFKPQGSEAFSGASLNQNQDAQDFGKPFPQEYSGENFNRPSSGNFNGKPTFGQSQINKGSTNSLNRFPQPSGQFVTQNEYLPPSNNNQPQPNKSEASALTSNSGISNSGQELQKEQSPGFVALNRPKPNFASASASTFSQPTFQPQPARPLNAFIITQPKPNQFNQQNTQFTQQTSQPSSQTQSQFNTNSQQPGVFATQSVPDFGTKPTMIPDTELTTPLEPNENLASQDSQFPSQTTANFGSFVSEPANQVQAQFGFQENSAFGQPTGQNLSPSAPTPTSQFGAALPTLAFQSSVEKRPQNPNGNPQLSQNAFGQTQQNQPSSGQGIDNSYYYNQPSKAFGALAQRPQGSKFQSSPSYQSNGVASQNQFINKQGFQTPAFSSLSPVGATSATQTQGYKGVTQAAISSFPTVLQSRPTQSSQIGMTQTTQFGSRPSFNQQSSTGNQAQFTGAQPSYSQQSTTGNRAQENIQYGSVGTPVQSPGTQSSYNQQSTFVNQAQVTGDQKIFSPVSTGTFPSDQKASTGSPTEPQFGLPQTSESSESLQQTTQTQQYQGTIYEYNKPAEVLPATQTDSTSGQSIPESKPSFGQSLNPQQNTKPVSQGSETKFDAQGNKPFGSLSSSFQFGQQAQTSQGNQISQSPGTQFASQPGKPFAQFGQTAQLNPIGSSAQQNQGIQTTHSFKPFGSASHDNQSPFGSKTQFGSQSTQFGQKTQSFGNQQPSLPETTASQPQLSPQNFQNFAPSQDNGYFYPANPKNQFGEESKNQFSQNPQPGRPQTGFTNQFNSVQGNSQSTSFNQQSQFNSASRPQFGAQNKNTQATFGQRVPNSPIQPFSQPQFVPSSASSQAFATGQATASASASTSNFEPFVTQDKTQIPTQTDTQDQSGQGTQAGVQSTKPFGTQESTELGSKPFRSSSSGKPLFKSACCQASKDSTPAQTTDRSSSFPGTQSFNTQTLTGTEEQFGGPRQAPSFDEQTGYHY